MLQPENCLRSEVRQRRPKRLFSFTLHHDSPPRLNLNSTLGARIYGQSSALHIENLRLRASEIALRSKLRLTRVTAHHNRRRVCRAFPSLPFTLLRPMSCLLHAAAILISFHCWLFLSQRLSRVCYTPPERSSPLTLPTGNPPFPVSRSSFYTDRRLS